MTVVVVMGVSGSGKSTVAAVLARALRMPFAEGDAFHPAANIAKMRAGAPLDDCDRAPWLDAVAGWMAAHQAGGVVSCSALRRRYRDRLRAAAPEAFFVHLDGDPDLLRRRMSGREGHFMPAALLESQLAALEPLSADELGMTVDVSGTPQDIAARVWSVLHL